MSSIRLLKDHGNSRKGAVVSVPFHKGKELIAGGIGVYASEPMPIEKPFKKQQQSIRAGLVELPQQQADESKEPAKEPAKEPTKEHPKDPAKEPAKKDK